MSSNATTQAGLNLCFSILLRFEESNTKDYVMQCFLIQRFIATKTNFILQLFVRLSEIDSAIEYYNRPKNKRRENATFAIDRLSLGNQFSKGNKMRSKLTSFENSLQNW